MRLPIAGDTALLAAIGFAITLAGCGVPDAPAHDTAAEATTGPAEVIQPGTPAPVIPDTASDGDGAGGGTPTAEPTETPTSEQLDTVLLEEGRFTLATTRPSAPTPGNGAWDQEHVGARGQAGATCEAGTPVAWVTVSAEHYKHAAGAWSDDEVAGHLTGGTVTLTATTPDGEDTLVEYLLPSPAHKPIRHVFDLERLTDPVLARAGLYWDLDYAGMRPGELVGALLDRDPHAPDPVDEFEAWKGYEGSGFFRTFEIAAPSLPVPADAEALTFTYALDGHEPAVLDVPVPEC